MNIFSGEATTKFPTAMQMARGGVSFSISSLVSGTGVFYSCNKDLPTFSFFVVCSGLIEFKMLIFSNFTILRVDFSRCNGAWKNCDDNCSNTCPTW